jgi:hypothetical protein
VHKAVMVSTVSLLMACGRQTPMSGDWTACYRSDGPSRSPVCGNVNVAQSPTSFVGSPVYFVTHSVPLIAILPPGSARDTGSFGSLRRRDGDYWELTIGTAQGVVYQSGAPLAQLRLRGDTLMGTWSRSCFAGCPGNGTVLMFRPRGAS